MKVVERDRIITYFENDMESALTVKAGETFKLKTNDCFCGQVKGGMKTPIEIDESKSDAATGPVFVEGAEPGDILKVKIEKIEVADSGVSMLFPGEGVIGDMVKEEMIREIPVEDGAIKFCGLSIPIRPMLGVIGVAPAKEDGAWHAEVPWKHGGNMDTTDITEGTTLYFPVNQKGALFAAGDCHAVMGDGESCVTGLEIDAEATFSVDVIKNRMTTWPILETEEGTMIIASGDTLQHACENAVKEAVSILSKGLSISWEDAYILVSLACDLRISQCVNQKKTVRVVIGKEILTTEEVINTL